MSPCYCSVIHHRGHQNVVKPLVTLSHYYANHFFILTHFDIICDLQFALWYRCMAKWTLYTVLILGHVERSFLHH